MAPSITNQASSTRSGSESRLANAAWAAGPRERRCPFLRSAFAVIHDVLFILHDDDPPACCAPVRNSSVREFGTLGETALDEGPHGLLDVLQVGQDRADAHLLEVSLHPHSHAARQDRLAIRDDGQHLAVSVPASGSNPCGPEL